MKKVILNKLDNGYILLVDDIMYATDNDKLSKQNCDEIFGVINIDKIFLDCYGKALNKNAIIRQEGFTEGFNKAMELQKDKLFTEADIRKAYHVGRVFRNNHVAGVGTQASDALVESLKQPTTIEVVMEMENVNGGLDEMAQPLYFKVPKLDKDGCLILKKK